MITSRRIWEQAARQSGCTAVALEHAAQIARGSDAPGAAHALDQLCDFLCEPQLISAEADLARFAHASNDALHLTTARTVDALLTAARRIALEEAPRRDRADIDQEAA